MIPNFRVVDLSECLQHVDALASLWQLCLSQAWDENFNLNSAREELLRRASGAGQVPSALVAMSGDEPIGMCSLIFCNKTYAYPYDIPLLSTLCVAPAARGMGIGAALVDAVVKRAIELKLCEIFLFTVDMSIYNWYNTLGFDFDGTQAWPNKTDCILMRSGLS